MGARHWTKKKFYAKCDAVAKTVFWLADRYGRMPDVIGLAEVENRGVLTRMLSSTLMRKYDYGIVHRESGDRRGIDVALLYRKSVMDTLSTSFVTPVYEGKPMQTRDILHARMSLADGSVADFIVNHHPSKFGGEEESRGRRDAAMETLKHFCDSLKGDQMIVMGDFNDTPDAEQFRMLDGLLVNKAEGLHQRREGTIRYEGKWELIDMFMTSPSLDAESRMEIVRVPFLMTYEKKHPGEKPLRTYVGPRYTGGVSDHCPIVLRVYFQ
jgi:endonuclease/exonuclease/phosphatase family metal-dependent hydrolase